MKPRLLYLAASNPVTPSTGMGMVIREHINELLNIHEISVHGVVILPPTLGKAEKLPNVPWSNFKFFVGDLQHEIKAIERLRKKIFVILSGKLLDHYAFRSAQARQHLHRELELKYDIVIVDSLIPLCNISIRKIKKHSTKIIFVAHTVSAHEILDSGRLKTGIVKKIYHYIEAFQSLLLQTTIIKMADVSIFLSEWDRHFFDPKKQLRTIALCPTFNASRPNSFFQNDIEKKLRAVVFIGSPSFSPNKFAIDWIINSLADILFKVDPTISIILVGKGTEKYSGCNPGNVIGRGFISDSDLTDMLQNCLALLSPVIHGSGIKIKILEAFSVGCPVLATGISLRGFEFMKIEPKIDLQRPASVVYEIVSLANNENLRRMGRKEIRRRWEEHVSFRNGRLKNVISDVISSSLKK